MFKKIKAYLKNRKERELRHSLTVSAGRYNSSAEIQEWVEFVLYGKPTSVLLMSSSEQKRGRVVLRMLDKRRLLEANENKV